MTHRAKPLFPGALVVVCALVLSMVLAACGDDDGGTATTGTSAAPATSGGDGATAPDVLDETAALVYFTRGEHLAVAGRDLPSGASALEPAIRAVLEGPNELERDEVDLDTEAPSGSRLHRATITGSLATVDLSSEFQSGGGSLSMRMRVAQVVFTATEVAGVERVTITIDGEPVDGLGGEGVEVDAVGRSDFEDLLPSILVQRPVPGQQVDHTLEISGLANVFEGTVSIEVLDAGGAVVATGFGTGAMGEWRPFDATLTIPAAVTGDVIVRCFWESPEDGSERDVVEVPVTLRS